MIDFFEGLKFDNSILISIIAINLTLIGLTSLAETKKVMGIDYGRFLINEYVFFLPFRITVKLKYWLGFFIMVNGMAVVSLFFTKYMIVVIFLSFILSFCLVTLLAYFFFFIIQVNPNIRKQIYIKTFSVMYTSLNPRNKEGVKRPHSYFDSKLDISDGSPTKKRIVSSVYKYFDEDSHEVQKVFEDVFSINSVIYKPEGKNNRRAINYFVKKYNQNETKRKDEISHSMIVSNEEINNPYRYRLIDGCYDISHEFFQMMRNTLLQGRWCTSMFYLSKKEGTYNFITYSNIVRITCNLGLYGKSDDINAYKFIQFIMREYINSVTSEAIENEIYEKRQDNVLDPHGIKKNCKNIDYKAIERDFLINFYNLSLKSILKYSEDNLLMPIKEVKSCIETMIKNHSKLNTEEKLKLFNNVLEDMSKSSKNLSKLVDANVN